MSGPTPSKKKERAKKARKKQLKREKLMRLRPKVQKLEDMLHPNITWDEGLKAFYECELIGKEEFERLFKECSEEALRRSKLEALLKKPKRKKHT